jgi:hypothetical protein
MKLSKALLLVALLATHTASAATLTVTTTTDSGVGSLRTALKNARNGDTINFAVTGTISLTSGELLVSKSLNILGPGAGSLAVDGNHAFRVFHIAPGTTVTLAGLSVVNGQPIAKPATSRASAAGIWNDHATLTVNNCIVSGNSASGDGGGIYNDGSGSYNGRQPGRATLTVVNTTFSGNSASGNQGGGIFNWANYGTGIVTIVNCTFAGNTAPFGAGICNWSGGNMTVANSTLSGNSATGGYSEGGGILNGSTLNVTGCTFVGNSATGQDGRGGAIYNHAGALTVTDSILSDNFTSRHLGNGIYNYVYGSLTYGFDLFFNGGWSELENSGGTVTAIGPNVFGQNPLLGPLQDNGGPTWTHAPQPGSLAIDRGYNFSGAATDQRGAARTVDFLDVTNLPGGDGTDIGAVEVQ